MLEEGLRPASLRVHPGSGEFSLSTDERILEFGGSKVCFPKIRFTQVGLEEIYISKVGASGVRSFKVRTD
jgi:hypothetical protein